MNSPVEPPPGLTVFGSALLRVSPDLASITVSVTSTHADPSAAFRETRARAQTVRTFLSKASIDDVQSSRMTLRQETSYREGRRLHVGYTARMTLHIVVHHLNRVEDILTGVIERGANEIDEVSFRTRHLKRHRAEARRLAVASAREKAGVYAEAAGVALGPVLRIEDVNPDPLRGSEGQVASQMEAADETEAFDPGSISVGAAVRISYALADPS
ncbi:MAG: SIMPL domain-containing protein [Bacteroidota bacterium]